HLACVRLGVTLGFSGQADLNGDLIIPLTGLPPLPPSLTVDAMTLTALGDPTQSGASIGNPDTARAVQVSTGGAFAAQQSLNVKRGQISNAAALGISGITLQPIWQHARKRSMPEYLAPGVFVEEVSFRPSQIQPASTSVAAMVGATRTGQVRGRPQLLTSFADFERYYGDANGLNFNGTTVTNYTA